MASLKTHRHIRTYTHIHLFKVIKLQQKITQPDAEREKEREREREREREMINLLLFSTQTAKRHLPKPRLEFNQPRLSESTACSRRSFVFCVTGRPIGTSTCRPLVSVRFYARRRCSCSSRRSAKTSQQTHLSLF